MAESSQVAAVDGGPSVVRLRPGQFAEVLAGLDPRLQILRLGQRFFVAEVLPSRLHRYRGTLHANENMPGMELFVFGLMRIVVGMQGGIVDFGLLSDRQERN